MDLSSTKDISNPALLGAMEAYTKEKNDNTSVELMRAFSAATLLIPVLPRNTPREPLNFINVNLSDGRGPFLFAFTDADALAACDVAKNCACLSVKIDQIASMLKQNKKINGLLLNPDLQNMVFVRKQLLQMAQFPAITKDMKLEKGTKISFGQPKKAPKPALLDALRKVLETDDSVTSATLYWAYYDDEAAGHYMLGVDGASDESVLFAKLGAAAHPVLPKGVFMDIFPASSPVFEIDTRDIEPFYQKKRFRFF